MVNYIAGVISGMTLCGIGAVIYFIIHYLDTPERQIIKFIKKHKLIPKSKVDIVRWEDNKYLVSYGLEVISVEYLRQLFKIREGANLKYDLQYDFFKETIEKYFQFIDANDDERFIVVRGGTDLLRPPEPPKEYPPLPQGWEDCEI